MSVYAVPCAPNGQTRWRQVTDLGGRDYLLTFTWNGRIGRWFLDVATESGDVIREGAPLAPGFPVLRGVRDDARPEGELYLADTQEASGLDDPSFTSLGARHLLLYLDGEDLP